MLYFSYRCKLEKSFVFCWHELVFSIKVFFSSDTFLLNRTCEGKITLTEKGKLINQFGFVDEVENYQSKYHIPVLSAEP